MEKHTVNPFIRVFPSLTDVAFLMPVVMLFLVMDGAKAMLGDGDTGWHLRTGEWILTNGRVPTVDIFSFTKAGEPWFAWEWLWDVIFGWMHLNWGMESVVLGNVLVLCVTFAVLFRLVVRQSGNVLVSIAITMLAMMASSIHWLARPHLFTLLFVVVFLSILERVREGQTRLLYFLPPVMLVWTNLHGGFFVGIILVGTYAAGEWMGALLTASTAERKDALHRSVPYLIAAAACFAVTFVNPYGYHLHVHIVQYLREPYHQKNIVEFQTASFQPSIARCFEALLALGVVTCVWAYRRRDYLYILLIVTWAHLALVVARNIPIYALVCAPVIARCIHHAIAAASGWNVAGWLRSAGTQLDEVSKEIGSVDRIGRVHAASALAFALLCIVMYAPGAEGKIKADFDPKRYPAAALQSLGASELSAGVFTDDEWGDYLIYALYPNGKVFIDGRSDFYGPKFGNQFIGILDVKHDWQNSLRQYAVRTVLLPVASPLAGALKESRNWSVAYDDGIAIAFRVSTTETVAPTGFAAFRSEKNRDREITKSPTVISRSPIQSTRRISQ